MIRLNRMTDYAVVLLANMARRPDALVSVAGLARDSGVPAPSVAKLMKSLAQAGIVSAQRGAGGGYFLSRPATAITVAEIITALEGPIALTACVSGSDEDCNVAPICAMRGNWNQVNQAIDDALHKVTLMDMAQQPDGFDFWPNAVQNTAPKSNVTEGQR